MDLTRFPKPSQRLGATEARLRRYAVAGDPFGRWRMSIFQITQKSSSAVLWTGCAHDEKTALDAMAREAGYADYASLPDRIRANGVETAKLDLIS